MPRIPEQFPRAEILVLFVNDVPHEVARETLENAHCSIKSFVQFGCLQFIAEIPQNLAEVTARKLSELPPVYSAIVIS